MKLAWLVQESEDDEVEIHFEDPGCRRKYWFKVTPIVYAEIQE